MGSLCCKMEDLHKMDDDQETVIEKDGCSSMVMQNDAEETAELGKLPLRQRLDHLIHCNTFMVVIIMLVIADILVVFTQLLFDLEIHLGNGEHLVPKILHFVSVAILSVFLIELAIRLYVLKLSFFKHKLEVFDAAIVIISFILDVVFRNYMDASVGNLLIVLRLWRVTRIVNGIVMSVQKQANKKIQNEKLRAEKLEEELKTLQEYSAAQKKEIERLQQLLQQNEIEFVFRTLSQPTHSTQLDTVADVSSSRDNTVKFNSEIQATDIDIGHAISSYSL